MTVVISLIDCDGLDIWSFWLTYDICAETSGREARGTFDFGHLAFNVSDAGEVDEVEWVL